jgi:predicted permease
MSEWIRIFSSRFIGLFRNRRLDRDLDSELRFHLDMQIQDNLKKGMNQEEARHAALQDFGEVDQVKEKYRDISSLRCVEDFFQDVRYSLRTFGRKPLLALVVIITLALGIGGSTAIFSVFNAVLLRELPYQDPDQLYLLNSVTPDGSPTGGITPVALRPFYEAESHPIVEAAALAWSQEVQIEGSDGRAHSTIRYGVTDQFFEIFGSNLYLGKPFERGQRPGVLIIAYSTWRDMFASDPDIIGKPVKAEGRPMEVVGVTRPDFEFPENPGYWYLMSLGTRYDNISGYKGFIRLRPGFSKEVLQSEVTRVAKELGPDPATNQPTVLVARPFLEYIVGDLRSTVTILFGATAVLLLIACINVTNLLLSNATARTKEIALREALGAKRWRITMQFITESLFLATIGGALGLACAVIGVKVLIRIAPSNLPRLDTVPIDGTVLLFALGVSVLAGILTGMAPAWRLSRNSLNCLVNEGGRGTPGGPRRTRLFSTLVVAEIAMAVVLVISAGLLVRSYFNLTGTDPGFNPDRVLTLFMHLPYPPEYSVKLGPGGERIFTGSYAPIANFFRELLPRIEGLPGVKSVSTTTNLPLDNYQYGTLTLFNLPGLPGENSKKTAQPAVTESISPDYFHTMEIRLLSGRSFQPSDRPGSPGVAVVNETFVRRFLTGLNPLGQRIRFPENPYVPTDVGFQISQRLVDELEIVGVVEDVRYLTLADPPEPRIYLSHEQWITRHRTIVVRTAIENPESLVTAIRTEIEAMDPLLSADFELYTQIVHNSLTRERFATTLLVLFGLFALVLAAVGIYGLMVYSVTQRMGEIAVRSAMGATSYRILNLIMSRGIGLAICGIAIGIIGAVLLRQVVASQLYGVTALDIRIFAMASISLFLVAIFACLIPALRAMRIQPAELLQTE